MSKGHRILPSVFKRWFDVRRGLLCQCSAASFGAGDGLDDYVEVRKVRREHVPAALAKKSHLLGGEGTLVRHNGDCVVQVGSLGGCQGRPWPSLFLRGLATAPPDSRAASADLGRARDRGKRGMRKEGRVYH